MSRELDQEVAVKVMGYSLWTNFETGDYEGEHPMWHDGAVYEDEESGDVDHYFEPSTDIAAAFQVVAKMRDRGFRVEIMQFWDNHWRVFFHDRPIEREGIAANEPLEVCICRAALSALASKKGDAR